MRYLSTRGGIAPISFAEAVMMGLATDGGLLLPREIPRFEAAELRRLAGLPFTRLALEIMTPFVGEDLPREELAALLDRSFASFTHPEVTPLVAVGDRFVLELFHGPTLAFKDVALQFLGNLFEYLLARSGDTLNILGATSGDTGSAAIHGVRGKKGIQIFILHPHKRVSPVQERQMTTVLDANVHNVAVEGTFDDGQRIVKELFNDLPFKRARRLGAINSINWARILAQIVYYFYAWGRVSGGDPGKPVVFSVPTGNFGDIFAGYVAWRMGLPVARLILATNRNDILSRFAQSGIYAPAHEVFPTVSPSMDIQVASNFERYLYYLLGEDPRAVVAWLEEAGRSGRMALSGEKLREMAALFTGEQVDEERTLAQIRDTWRQHGYLLDPHTAVGMAAGVPGCVCLATAHPAKFGAAVREAVGFEPPLEGPLQGLLERPHRLTVLPASAAEVKAFMEETLSRVG